MVRTTCSQPATTGISSAPRMAKYTSNLKITLDAFLAVLGEGLRLVNWLKLRTNQILFNQYVEPYKI
jgi:hypothetical protein